MYVDYPYNVDERGRTLATSYEDYVRDLIELILFTSPGERVNRPSFGTGLWRFVFEPNDPALAAALTTTAQASLQLWLGDLLVVQDLVIEAIDSTLLVTVQYVLRETGESVVAQVRRQF